MAESFSMLPSMLRIGSLIYTHTHTHTHTHWILFYGLLDFGWDRELTVVQDTEVVLGLLSSLLDGDLLGGNGNDACHLCLCT